MAYTTIPERTAINPIVGRGSWNAQVKGNIEYILGKQAGQTETVFDKPIVVPGISLTGGSPLAPLTLHDRQVVTGDPSDVDPSVSLTTLGWWRIRAYSRGSLQGGTGGTQTGTYEHRQLIISGASYYPRHTIRAAEGETSYWSLSAERLIEVTVNPTTVSVTFACSGLGSDGTGSFSTAEAEIFATYDGPSA